MGFEGLEGRQMGCSRLFLILSFYFVLISAEYPYFRFDCDNNGNFTANSNYGNNLDHLFSPLSSSTVDFNYGFYNMSVGRGPNQINVIGLCRGDLKEDACKSCLNETVSKLERRCPNYKEAIGWSEVCTLRYSNQEIFGSMKSSPFVILYNVNSASDVDRFNETLSSLLTNLSSRAAAGSSFRKYAADNVTDPDLFLKIYALLQCTPDMSQQDCNECLGTAIGRISSDCYGKIGCRVLQPSCNLRYETRPFFAAVDDIRQPSPRPFSPSPTEEFPTGNGNGSHASRTIIITVVASVIGIQSLVLCVWIRLRPRIIRKPRENVETAGADEIITAESLQYDLDTVRAATNNFSDENKLGQGGFGAVYKGKLPNGQNVAVKRLSSSSKQGDSEFKNEVLLVAKLQHRNLVKLLGFCLEGKERLLIYEFMANASLDNFIFDPIKHAQLNWERRYKIIGGIARGLLYLHEDSRFRIIHHDLKASNILLDEDMNSKIADFGMVRLFVRDETQGNTDRVVGTYGYMAPEYVMHGQFSVKSDVFSFGVLLLEIVSGQKNNCFQNGENVENRLSYAWKSWREGTGLNLVDPTLRNGLTAEMMRCIHIGLLCVQENVTDRPTMASVVLMLNSNSASLPVPSQPAFFIHSTIESNSKKSKEESLPLTNNDVSITELYPR